MAKAIDWVAVPLVAAAYWLRLVTQIAAERPAVMNGVNVTQLMSTIEAIKAKPELARFEFCTSNE
jgi:hypothetical protein